MNANRWTAEEKIFLEDLAGRYTLKDIQNRMRAYQKRNGLAIRSYDAIKIQMTLLGLSVSAYLIALAERRARILDIPRDQTRPWEKTYGMPINKQLKLTVIKLAKFREWAYQHPYLFCEIDPERLNWLMDDEDFCESTQDLTLPLRGRKRPVQRLDTGEVYSGVKAAARSVYVNKGCISQAIARGGKSAGTAWRYIDSIYGESA